MNARARLAETETIVDINDFRECCEIQRWFFDEGWVSKQIAVDNLQTLAECAGYIALHGQDAVQQILAAAFASGGGGSDG